jgi:hypothetical protein
MEVIELACPAEHETLLDHEMSLPTAKIDRERNFAGQRFVFHQRQETAWAPEQATGLEQNRTGITRATDQNADVRILRASGTTDAAGVSHGAGVLFNFVLKGTARLQYKSAEHEELYEGDSFMISDTHPITLAEISVDFELLQVSLSTRVF